MKITALALVILLAASTIPLQAQVVAPAPSPSAAPVKPEPTCPCDNANFKPLNEKARAVAEYWDARRQYKIASSISVTAALFALMARDGGLMNEAQNSLSNADSKLHAARSKAVSLEGIKLTDGDDKTVEIKLKKGVDYTL
jgi:hypothetical protein